MRLRSLGREDPLEKEMATHSSILAWRIPWTEEPGGLQSTGLQSRIRLKDRHTRGKGRAYVYSFYFSQNLAFCLSPSRCFGNSCTIKLNGKALLSCLAQNEPHLTPKYLQTEHPEVFQDSRGSASGEAREERTPGSLRFPLPTLALDTLLPVVCRAREASRTVMESTGDSRSHCGKVTR